MTASLAIYRASGAPAYSGTMMGTCRLCGMVGTGEPWKVWVKETFTGYDQLWPGTIVCHACLFCTDDRNALLTQHVGRAKLQRMRNYSHVVTRSGRWLPLMKNQKRELAAALLNTDRPLVAVVSLAGQKHLIMRARLDWWQVEESVMRPDPDRLCVLLPSIEGLYDAGATKGMIESGNYNHAFFRMGLTAWRQYEPMIRSARGSALFALAVWLAQKAETTDDDGDSRPSDDAAPANLDGDSVRVQEQI